MMILTLVRNYMPAHTQVINGGESTGNPEKLLIIALKYLDKLTDVN